MMHFVLNLRHTHLWLGLVALALLSFCAPHSSADELFPESLAKRGGAYKAESIIPVYPYKVHDTILIKIRVKDTVEFTRKLKTQKATTLGGKIKKFITYFGKGESQLPSIEMETASDFESKGNAKDEKKVDIRVPAEIIEILPNGDLVLDASRKIDLSNDSATVRMGGRVNPMFVLADYTVDSERILNLMVSTEADGPLDDSQRRSFIQRFFEFFF